MNKKFSTLVAALFAAGALVLPTDLFAQLQYANGDYADQTNVKTVASGTYYLTFEEDGIDYVAYVAGNTLNSIPLLQANDSHVLKVTRKGSAGSYSYALASADGSNYLGFDSNYQLGGSNTSDTYGMQGFSLNADGTIQINYGTAYINRNGLDWSMGTSQPTTTFKGKLLASRALTPIEEARDVVAGDIDFDGTSYVIMAAGQVLDGDKDGEASFVPYVGKQSTYWTLEKHETTAAEGYAYLKNKETGKYMTIDGDQVAVKISKSGDTWSFTADGFQLYVITDWNTPKTVVMDGVEMSSFKLGGTYMTPISARELRTIFGDSFGVEMKKGNDALQNNPFSGSLKPVQLKKTSAGKYTETVEADYYSDSFMLQKENGNLIVMQETKKYADATATYGYAIVEVSAHDLALDLNGDTEKGYVPFFTFYAGEEFATGLDKAIDFIVVKDADNNVYTLGSLNYGANEGKPTLSAEKNMGLTYLDYISINLGTFNTVDVKKLLASPAFFTLTNKNTKATYSTNYGKVLGLDQDGNIAWVNADEALIGYPETEFAITYDPDTKYLTLKNRENPSQSNKTYHESQIYNIAGKTNVFAINGDTIEFKANTQYKESDGYLRLDAQKLKDQLYYVGVSSSVWNGIAYVSENHKDNHQVGLDVNQEDATKWNLAAAWYTEKNSLGEVTVSRPDTIQIGSTMSYWSAADNAFKTTDKDGKQTIFLKLLAYSMQNEDNAEYMAYRWSDTRYATGNGSTGYKSGDYFALKMTGDDKYNLVAVEGSMGNRLLASDSKVYGGSSATKGILNKTGMYKQVEIDLFVFEPTEAPEYLKLNQGDVIKIFRNEYESNVLYEKGEFAGINNAVEFDKINPALYVDTAYYNRPGNNRWEYLLAVNVNRIDTTYQCNVPAHGTHHADTTYGRFLVNLADSAIVEDTRDVHVNKFVYDNGSRYARLGFVPGYHTNDTLFVDCAKHVSDTIEVGTADPQLVKLAFRVVDHETESFIIETGYKYPKEGYSTEISRGYLTYINGNLVVTNDKDAAEVFSLKNDDRTPTANENIAAGNIVVAGVNGAIVVKGAEGKNVIVSTILGKVVANEVVSSDNAQIAAPAGIVVVSVDGESFKVVVK